MGFPPVVALTYRAGVALDPGSLLPTSALLSPADPAPVLHISGHASRWLLVVDHAGNAVPARLDRLGLSDDALNDHIGIDIGIWSVTSQVAAALGAETLGQAYSRLVIDCNRQPGIPASIPLISDRREVPGNFGLPFAEARVAEIFRPYHDAIAAALAARKTPPLFCAMHSFTRVLAGSRREVDIGVICGQDTRLAAAVEAGLADCGLRVGRNTPYRIDFAGDYTLPVHAEPAGIPYVEIEICQDLISTAEGQQQLAAIMANALGVAQASLS